MGRYGSLSLEPDKIVAVASPKCFVAVKQEIGGMTYVPDYQVALAAWMGRWNSLRSRDYALIYSTNQPCEYPKDNEANPADYCTRLPEDVFANKWNVYGSTTLKESSTCRILMVQIMYCTTWREISNECCPILVPSTMVNSWTITL